MTHQDFRSLTPRAQETFRIKAMAALKEGRSKTGVARLSGVTRQAIHGWVNRKPEAGVSGLRARRGRPVGGGSGPNRDRPFAD
jgi:transposase